jgi:sialate O-acetylesterase
MHTADTVPHCGIACIIDTGEVRDIHPKNKQEVGRRLALVALAKTYGRDVVYSGPRFKSMTVEGDRVRVRFTHVGGGLVVRTSDAPSASNMAADGYAFALGNGPVKGFAVAGEDKKFAWAEATIDGEAVVVSSKDVPVPVAVRYAWADNPVCNLYNREGLPAFPFRTDDW